MSRLDLPAIEEAQLRRELEREQRSNRDFERNCPGAKPTAFYASGALPTSAFYTTRDYLRYRIDREHAKYNPERAAELRGAQSPKRTR